MAMHIRDYNGKGDWSVTSVQARYADYAGRYGVEVSRSLAPKEYERGDVRWVYPIMDAVIAGILSGDPACAAIGVEFIEEDRKFPFGANLKARAARAMRQSALPDALSVRIRRRIVDMLIAGNTPREYREYAKLLRKAGFREQWPRLDAGVPRANRHAMRYYRYFEAIHRREPAVCPLAVAPPVA
jgi:hypothetical protein